MLVFLIQCRWLQSLRLWRSTFSTLPSAVSKLLVVLSTVENYFFCFKLQTHSIFRVFTETRKWERSERGVRERSEREGCVCEREPREWKWRGRERLKHKNPFILLKYFRVQLTRDQLSLKSCSREETSKIFWGCQLRQLEFKLQSTALSDQN